jgi:probable F420-dependent oxidoreductase
VTGSIRPFRFGISVYESFNQADELLDLARRAESVGYSSVLVGDHLVEYDPPSIVALAWAAAQTETLRFGTLVLGNDFRHPAVLAKDAAQLDIVSGGRFELGLGAGWLRGDYDALGLTYDEPRVRVDRLAEALTIIKSCWAGEPFEFSGEHYTIGDYAARPARNPPPPIIVGGGSPRVLRLAGQEADIVGIHPSTARSDFVTDTQEERTLKKIEWVREGAGARFDELELMVAFDGAITDDREAAAAGFAADAGASIADTLASTALLIGSVEEVCEDLRARREALGISYVVFGWKEYEEFAPVVERLAGA